jgi:hypothetical protein
MVLAAVESTDVMYARIVRLLKHWNRNNDKPLCSWNIKALALGCITYPMTLLAGLQIWFAYAADQLSISETADPASVAPHPIKLNEKWTRTDVVRKLRLSLEIVEFAIRLSNAGYEVLAEEQLADLFDDEDMLPHPARSAVLKEQADRIADQTIKSSSFGSPALVTSTNAPRERVNARSWSA